MSLATRPDNPLTLRGPVAGSSSPDAEPRAIPCSSGAEPAGGAAPPEEPASPVSEEEEVLRQIRNLPPELAVLLLSVGALGFLLPGIIGTPALIAGGLALWPKAFGRAESWFEKRYPSAHRQSLHQMGRFLADLDRRYPRLSTGEPSQCVSRGGR
ncbi:MAG: hypothetical protein ACLQVF_10570 [Isosphaeraceae bacterium]